MIFLRYRMDTENLASLPDLHRRIGGIRSLSGVLRTAHHLTSRPLHFDESRVGVELAGRLIDRLREFAGDGLEERDPSLPEFRTLVELLLFRSAQYTVGGVDMAAGEADAREALRLARRTGRVDLETTALSHLGTSLLTRQMPAEASLAFREEVRLEREAGNESQLVRALYNLARALVGTGEKLEATVCVKEALDLYNREGPPPGPLYGKAFLLQIWQDLHSDSVEVDHSIEIARESIAILQQLGMTDRLISARLGLIRCYLLANDPVSGMEEVLEIERLVTPASSSFLQCQYLIGLTAVHAALGEWGFAEETGLQGLEMARDIGAPLLEAILLERLAEIARCRGNPKQGAEWAMKGLQVEKQPVKRAFLLRLHADILLDLGRVREAGREYAEGERLLLATDRQDPRGFFHVTRSRLLMREGKLEEAASLLTAITELPLPADRVVTQSHELLSEVYESLGRMKEALDTYRRHHDFTTTIEARRRKARLLELRAQHQLRWEHQRVVMELQREEGQTEELQKLAAEQLRMRERIPGLRSLLAEMVCEAGEEKRKEMAEKISELLDAVEPGEEIDLLDHLRGIDADFSRRLVETWPNLTPGQIRLASLLRAGLRSQEICDLLDITPATLQMQRKRLRKRLNLQTGDGLEESIMGV